MRETTAHQDYHGQRDESVGDGAVDELEVIEETPVVLAALHRLDIPAPPTGAVQLVHIGTLCV